MHEAFFFRLLSSDGKASALTDALSAANEGGVINAVVYAVDATSFRQVPGSPFAYWVSKRVRHLFADFNLAERTKFEADKGPDTGDDFRFLRAWWGGSTWQDQNKTDLMPNNASCKRCDTPDSIYPSLTKHALIRYFIPQNRSGTLCSFVRIRYRSRSRLLHGSRRFGRHAWNSVSGTNWSTAWNVGSAYSF